MVHRRAGPIWETLESQHDQEEPLRLRIVQATRIGHELGANPCMTIDRRLITVEGVEIDGVVDVSRKAGHDVCGRIIGKQRLSGRVVDIEDVVYCLDDEAIADAKPLIGRLHCELITTTGIALLIEIQSFEGGPEDRRGFGLATAMD